MSFPNQPHSPHPTRVGLNTAAPNRGPFDPISKIYRYTADGELTAAIDLVARIVRDALPVMSADNAAALADAVGQLADAA